MTFGMQLGWTRKILRWVVLFLICFGLGYPTLNRYDPRNSLPDSAVYAKIALDGPRAEPGHFRFRVLIPYLARSVYSLANGHVRSWDPLLFGFLVVNSMFVASTAFLLLQIGHAQVGDYAVALVGSTLFLLNFAVPNDQLAGLVDGGEGFFLMATVASLFFGRWWLLPALGILGALTKESFVPFSICLAGTWWLTSERLRAYRLNTGLWLGCMIVVEMATITVLQSSISGHLIWPWSFALSLNSHSNYARNFVAWFTDRNSWYVLIWLLPLGLLRIRRFPRPWVASSAATTFVALILNAYYGGMGGSGGGVGRFVFDVAGPLLSLSAATFLCDGNLGSSSPPRLHSDPGSSRSNQRFDIAIKSSGHLHAGTILAFAEQIC